MKGSAAAPPQADSHCEWNRKCPDPRCYSHRHTLTDHSPIDTLSTYHVSSSKTKTSSATQPTRYAIRQVLDQELRKTKALQASQIRIARGSGALTGSINDQAEDKENRNPGPESQALDQQQQQKPAKVKRDFFGRPIAGASLPTPPPELGGNIDASMIAKSTAAKGKARGADAGGSVGGDEGGRIWMSFNEGFSNAVRKPITLGDLMDGF